MSMNIWPTLTLFALISCVLSLHFRGGLLTWKAVNETEILVSHRVSYVYIHCSNPETNALQCFNGCTGSVIMNANCTESNSTENWADLEGITKFDVTNQTTKSFVLRFFSSAWISLVHSSGSWSLLMTVDLSVRSDTGKINQSPVSSVASSMIFSRHCWTYNNPYIPVADFDGDNVRCRFASGSDECASICGNHLLSFLTLNGSSCSFSINSSIANATDGDYAVALQIEDFANSSSSTPLSSVPLQFIITVQNWGYCFDSASFVYPTPAAGETLHAQNGSLQFHARAFTSQTKVTKFHIMSPLNFTMSDIVQYGSYEYEVTMSLDPNAEDLNETYVMCFSAETNERISSESRCITVKLGDIDDCQPEPCQNSGTCTDLVNDYQCGCVSGFNGTNCENNIDDCNPDPCQNNGTCNDLVNDYECDCVAGFNGTNCENNIDDCKPEPCQNNGTCTDQIIDFQCDCVAGFNGTQCDHNIDECQAEPCQNGTCIDLVNGYQCDCVSGFNGTNCDNNINDCLPNPCQNNGTCIDLVNDYNCDCVPGFNGTNCENDIDDCQPLPCQNNGTCTDLVNDYQCDCVAGFNGTNCENNVVLCASSPCKNNGTCIDLINRFQCQCPLEFNGTTCSTDSHLTKFTMELKLDVTVSEDLSSSTDYNTVKSKVYIALTEIYSTIPGSTVIIHSIRKGSLVVGFDLIIPDDPVSKVQVVDTVYKLVNGLVFVNYSGEVVNVTSASLNSSAGTVIITNSTDGCSIMNSQDVCAPGYRCHEFNNYTVACIPIINKGAILMLHCDLGFRNNILDVLIIFICKIV